MNSFQEAHVKAQRAYETAVTACKAERITIGLAARIDAAFTAEDVDALDALEPEESALIAKWNLSALDKALTNTETDLLRWSLGMAADMKPAIRSEIEALHRCLATVTRECPRKAEAIRLAMTLPA